MGFTVPITEYEACGQCGFTSPRQGNPSPLVVTTDDLARAITANHVSRLIGQPPSPSSYRGIILLVASLLRVRAVVRQDPRGRLMGHPFMDSHHGSARINLSQDFGTAIATSFLTHVHSCREHYNLDAVANRNHFGILSSKRPDIGSVTRAGLHVLTESKGRKHLRDLAPRTPSRVEPARLVRDSYQQLTSGGKAQLSPSTRLFLCVTSRVAANRALRLDAAEYVRGLHFMCRRCRSSNLPDDEDSRWPESRISELNWNALRSAWYRCFATLVGGTEADLDESHPYRVRELAGADVTIGLHQELYELASNSDSDLSPQLLTILDRLPEGIDAADDNGYSDGTLIRANWPEIESDTADKDDA